MSTQWYYAHDDKKLGPFSQQQLKEMAAAGTVLPIEIDGDGYVLWRSADGRVRGGPRYCPHLDHDLAEGLRNQ